MKKSATRSAHMSKAYHALWNDRVQARIDRDIDANRMADAAVKGIDPGREVTIEQLSHDFIFGAHIFNFDQLGTDERNARYKALFGTLFNSATIAFYWRTFEPVEGQPRFAGSYADSADFWNTVKDPKREPHWRRPATDPVVAFCESKGIRLHGHTLVWGSSRWQHPDWMYAKLPKALAERVRDLGPIREQNLLAPLIEEYSAEQLALLMPEYASVLNSSMMKRIADIALRYRDRIHSWDIVNESAADFERGAMVEGSAICKSWYGMMPGDYAYRALKTADAFFPKHVKLNINECTLTQAYVDQVADLRKRGCKIDVMGAQMHLFDPQVCRDIAAGKSDVQSPDRVWGTFATLAQADLPIHLSEITITSPGGDARGQAIQATIARNLYRLWFSIRNMMGITWWNVVDDCGAPGEPSVSGLFTRDMQPKASFHALDALINGEWKTHTTAQADRNGVLEFRGFRGQYRLAWTDAKGKAKAMLTHVA